MMSPPCVRHFIYEALFRYWLNNDFKTSSVVIGRKSRMIGVRQVVKIAWFAFALGARMSANFAFMYRWEQWKIQPSQCFFSSLSSSFPDYHRRCWLIPPMRFSTSNGTISYPRVGPCPRRAIPLHSPTVAVHGEQIYRFNLSLAPPIVDRSGYF